MKYQSPFQPERPMTPAERRRRVVRLCSSFMRNLAFHRVGMSGEVQRKLLDPDHPHGAFWREVHANFIDICVLEWCKLFADHDGKHHWRRVVEDHSSFEPDLCAKLGVTATQFAELVKQITHYRDKFVAHLDGERIMRLPALDLPKAAVAFLHARLVLQKGSNNWRGLAETAEELELGFEQASREAQAVYDEALGYHRTAF